MKTLENTIQEAQNQLVIAKNKVKFLEAFAFIAEFVETAVRMDFNESMTKVDVEVKMFRSLWSCGSLVPTVRNLKNEIKWFELINDTKPSWAKEALKNMKIVENGMDEFGGIL